MKKNVLALSLIVIFFLFSFNLFHVLAAEPSDTVISYFEALKNGDTEIIKNYIAGEFYEKNKALLEENTKYPEFLRNYYEGAEFRIRNSFEAGNDEIVEIGINFPNGSESIKKLRLKRYNDTSWKIVQEILG